MCLSSVYEERDGAEHLIFEHVSGITLEDGAILLTDIMGSESRIMGVITSIDLVKNKIMVRAQ